MRTIGLLGGMSWESTLSYYQLINRMVRSRLDGLHSAKIILISVDFAEIEALQQAGDWSKAGDLLAKAAIQLERGGADCLVICTNTMHKVADQISQAVSIPLLHVATATGQVLKQQSVAKVGLLGTRFTMEQMFYRQKITQDFDIEVIIPNEAQITSVHQIIYQELCLGITNPTSKQKYLKIIDSLAARGAQGIILGCTEIAMLVSQTDTSVPLFDTTAIHAISAVDFALA